MVSLLSVLTVFSNRYVGTESNSVPYIHESLVIQMFFKQQPETKYTKTENRKERRIFVLFRW